jgi:hypothetical protein
MIALNMFRQFTKTDHSMAMLIMELSGKKGDRREK